MMSRVNQAVLPALHTSLLCAGSILNLDSFETTTPFRTVARRGNFAAIARRNLS